MWDATPLKTCYDTHTYYNAEARNWGYTMTWCNNHYSHEEDICKRAVMNVVDYGASVTMLMAQSKPSPPCTSTPISSLKK